MKADTQNLFRMLVVFSTLVFIFQWTLPFFDYLWLDNEELELLGWAGHKSIIVPSITVYWSMFAGWLLLSLGLFFFNKLARTLFLIYLTLSLMLIFLFGYSVQSPLYTFLNTIVALSDGAIIAIAYLTSVNEKFNESTSQ